MAHTDEHFRVALVQRGARKYYRTHLLRDESRVIHQLLVRNETHDRDRDLQLKRLLSGAYTEGSFDCMDSIVILGRRLTIHLNVDDQDADDKFVFHATMTHQKLIRNSELVR